MKDAYWRQFIDIKIAEEYFFLYIHHSRRRVFALNALCLAVSCSGVFAWFANYLHPLLSSLIVLIAQIVSILQPLYPYSDRLYASDLIYREYKHQALLAEQTINHFLFGQLDEAEFSAKLDQLQLDIDGIVDKFCNPKTFPQNKRLHQVAQQHVTQYIDVHFNSRSV